MEKQTLKKATSSTEGLSRVDGRLKVTGAAKYSAEYKTDGLTYGVLVGSTITKGMITQIETRKAELAPGVLAVMTHLNAPKVPGYEDAGKKGLKVLFDNMILFNNQPIALIIADTFERALFAASLVKASYTTDAYETDLIKNLNNAKPVHSHDNGLYVRGTADAYKNAPVKFQAEYIIPSETHNPMELHAIIARWDSDEHLTVWDKTQGVKGTQHSLAQAFKLKPENVQVNAEFVGGAFGSALLTWPHEIVAVQAAKMVKRPVKLVLSRMDMFTSVGYRPYTWQKIALGADADGKLVGITHEATGQTATYQEFTESVLSMSRFMYACPNVNTTYKVAALDVGAPTWMRGPGEATGAFALESAMDELSYALKIDPIELRLRNYADTDPENGKPFSSKYLNEAYKMGMDAIGWKERKQEPGKVLQDGWLVGYGMGSGTFGAYRSGATVRAVLTNDGTLLLQSAVTDIGPGTGTFMVQIASEMMGLPSDKIKVNLGDSSLPNAPSQGGSSITATVGSAVNDACRDLKEKFQQLIGNGGMDKIDYVKVLKDHNLDKLEVSTQSHGGEEQKKYSFYSFSVHFAQVLVNPLTGVVRVSKVVSVADSGHIVSPKTARSQVIGGAIGGIGMALMEESIIDHRYGRYINNNFADYHVPVNADIPQIEALFVNKPDPYINPMGSKGMGEIALIGMSAAIANAVYNATGKRVRDLPITPDKLL